ncbi:hypothetical protein MBCUT_06350 [Methanobrevibacter cuticularis]|uniref:Uncharacterized protein n=1 Tax=Methanobrevibacter cuticularis TaxID=47311 RepID=A0A166EKY7_9EURY|nr:hypothetical protein [Methanobrevibacter cuticularis]KZX16771.1 hypothetical protein MBCUT_06350 [Methanobrevibacter cuticularis]
MIYKSQADVKIINIFISTLPNTKNELLEFIKAIIELNSRIKPEKLVLFKIIGNSYAKDFISQLILKEEKSEKKIKELENLSPISISDVLFDKYEACDYQFKEGCFKIKGIEYSLIENYSNIYILIARKSLQDDEYDLIREFKSFDKEKEKSFFYFSNRENSLFENYNQNPLKTVHGFKKSLKSEGYKYTSYYDSEEFYKLIKKQLTDIIYQEKRTAKRTRLFDHYTPLINENLSSIFVLLTSIGKYLYNFKPKKIEQDAISELFEENEYPLKEYVEGFGKNSLEDTAIYLIEEGFIHLTNKECKSAVHDLTELYLRKKEAEKIINEIEEYLSNNAFLDNNELKNEMNQNNYLDIIKNANEKSEDDKLEDKQSNDEKVIYEELKDKKLEYGQSDDEKLGYKELDDFKLFEEFDYKNSLRRFSFILYMKDNENSEIHKIIEKMKKELKMPSINSYFLYLTSFFFDLNEKLELFTAYYSELINKKIVDDFYNSEWEEKEEDIDNPDELSEELKEDIDNPDELSGELKEDVVKNINKEESEYDEFIISTSDFLDDWTQYYSMFRKEILKPFEVNIKLAILLNSLIEEENDKKLLFRFRQLTKYLTYEINISLDNLNSLKGMNDTLQDLKNKKIEDQYNIIRKFINKWRKNILIIRNGLDSL